MIKPGKVTCVGLVAVMLVLPTSIWKGGSAGASVRVSLPKRGIQDRDAKNRRAPARD
jgi:hypothetical protein